MILPEPVIEPYPLPARIAIAATLMFLSWVGVFEAAFSLVEKIR